ncbi:MAG: hypothetical protein AB7G80_05175 [Dongiaceae bacterium]
MLDQITADASLNDHDVEATFRVLMDAQSKVAKAGINPQAIASAFLTMAVCLYIGHFGEREASALLGKVAQNIGAKAGPLH